MLKCCNFLNAPDCSSCSVICLYYLVFVQTLLKYCGNIQYFISSYYFYNIHKGIWLPTPSAELSNPCHFYLPMFPTSSQLPDCFHLPTHPVKHSNVNAHPSLSQGHFTYRYNQVLWQWVIILERKRVATNVLPPPNPGLLSTTHFGNTGQLSAKPCARVETTPFGHCPGPEKCRLTQIRNSSFHQRLLELISGWI